VVRTDRESLKRLALVHDGPGVQAAGADEHCHADAGGGGRLGHAHDGRGHLNPAQATAAALATLQALTPSPAVTALPVTGFADEGGFPTLLVLGAALVVVVIVARRMGMRPIA